MALAMPPAAPSRSRSDPDAVLKDPTFRQSVAFIQDVQTRFRPTPARFQEFLVAFEMLHQPGGGGGGGGRTSVHFLDDDDSNDNSRHNAGLPAVYDKMAALLGDQPDLLARFEAFLPHGYALRRRLEREAAAGERGCRWRARGDVEDEGV